MRIGGIAALLCYAVHAGFHVSHGRWYDALWVCHIAAVLIGVGLLTQRSTLNSVGVLLSVMGLPLWVYDLAVGGEFFPSSLLTHVVAPALGLYGAARMGMARGAWWKASVVLFAVIGLCRWTTPAAANVNIAFELFNRSGDSPFNAQRFAGRIAAATAYFLVIERLLRRLFVDADRQSDRGERSVRPQ